MNRMSESSTVHARIGANREHVSTSTRVMGSLFDHFPDLMHSVNENGMIIDANRAVSRLLGYSLEEYLGKSIHEVYSARNHDELVDGLAELVLEGESGEKRTCMVTKEGHELPVEIRSVAIYREDGTFDRTLSVIRDISNILEYKESMRTASRLTARGELAGYIAHDLRSPLSVLALQGFALEALSPDQPDLDKRLGRISRSVDASVEQIGELLEILDRQDVDVDTHSLCDIKTTVQKSINRVSSAAILKNVSVVHVSDARHELIAHGDEYRLRQAFGNLLNNAILAVYEKFHGEPGGIVTVKAESVHDGVVVEIADNGVGISKDIEPNILEPFFTTRAETKGTGLGLAIVRKVVDEHRGTLDFSSRSMTRFRIWLPR